MSIVPGEPGNDKPSLAISQDAGEYVHIAYVCNLPACSAGRRGAVFLIRVDRAGVPSRDPIPGETRVVRNSPP